MKEFRDMSYLFEQVIRSVESWGLLMGVEYLNIEYWTLSVISVLGTQGRWLVTSRTWMSLSKFITLEKLLQKFMEVETIWVKKERAYLMFFFGLLPFVGFILFYFRRTSCSVRYSLGLHLLTPVAWRVS